MSSIGLIVADPGHFHAALVQQEMHPDLSAKVHVYPPTGPGLVDHLSRIARFNTRRERPTSWEIEVHACPNYGITVTVYSTPVSQGCAARSDGCGADDRRLGSDRRAWANRYIRNPYLVNCHCN